MSARISKLETIVLEFFLHVFSNYAQRWSGNNVEKISFLHPCQIVSSLGCLPLRVPSLRLGIKGREVLGDHMVIQQADRTDPGQNDTSPVQGVLKTGDGLCQKSPYTRVSNLGGSGAQVFGGSDQPRAFFLGNYV